MKQIISTDKAPSAIGPYSQAVLANNLLFVSGQIPLDPATGELIPETTIQAQTTRVLTNLKAIVEQAGSTLDNVVKTTVFLKNMDDFVEMNRIYKTFFSVDCPARSAVQVAKLPKDVLVEIETIAAL
ncbi:MAG: RidA family protein [Lawsonibacter sp.]|nr:RidA family protein [Lawsonibacter sp.]